MIVRNCIHLHTMHISKILNYIKCVNHERIKYNKRADYRWGWSGESIDFAVFFEIWKWFAHEATNHDCPEYYIFCRDVVFQECFIFCLAFWKIKMSIYNDFDACIEFCIILLYILPYVHICIIYIYTLVDKFIAFSQSFMFFENYVFDIEQTWVQFPATNSAFSEKCSASFHAVHECFSQKNMSRLNMHLFKRWFNYDWI